VSELDSDLSLSVKGAGYCLRLISGEAGGPAAAALRAGLSVLSVVYGAGLAMFLLPYKLGIRKRKRLDRPVISIGNITFGGTGKTPTVRTIAAKLLARGARPVILSRGYGGSLGGRTAIVSDGSSRMLSAEECGDEPAMLADLLPGVPVVIGKNRRKSGRLAIDKFDPDVILLDDGLQYWQMHRDMDIVLINAVEPFGYGRLMPRGMLREPVAGLRRAAAVLITNSDRVAPERLSELKDRVAGIAPSATLVECRARPGDLRGLDGRKLGTDWLRGRRVCAFCSIGSPALFAETLTGLGADVALEFGYPDHHRWKPEEIQRIAAAAVDAGAEAIVTTEKDAVKLPRGKTPVPVVVSDVTIEFEPRSFVDAALDTVGKVEAKR